MAANKTMRQQGSNKGENGGFSTVNCEMQKSPIFRTLSATALRILLWALYRNYNAASNKSKGDTTNPCFKFTNAEALNKLGMSSKVFTRGKDELAEKGFIRWRIRGGLKGANGTASYFELSSDWKNMKPPPKAQRDMKAARAAKMAAKKQESS